MTTQLLSHRCVHPPACHAKGGCSDGLQAGSSVLVPQISFLTSTALFSWKTPGVGLAGDLLEACGDIALPPPHCEAPPGPLGSPGPFPCRLWTKAARLVSVATACGSVDPTPTSLWAPALGGGSALRRGGPSSTQSILIGKINSPRPSQPPTLAWDPYMCQFLRDKLTCNQGDLGVCVGAAPGCTAQAVHGRVWKGPVTISQSGAITRWPPSRAPGEDLVAARGGRRPLLWDGDPHAGRGDICGHGSAHSSAHLTTLPE